MKTTDALPRFRHQNFMDALAVPCPPDEFLARKTLAFRWVFETMEDARNFEPQFFKNPRRFIQKSDAEKCVAIGLSVFDSERNARLHFVALKKRIKGEALKMGTNVAFAQLHLDFGKTDLPNRTGHFTFHPFENVDLSQHFSIVSAL